MRKIAGQERELIALRGQVDKLQRQPATNGKAEATLNRGALMHIQRLTSALNDSLVLIDRLSQAPVHLPYPSILDEMLQPLQQAIAESKTRNDKWNTLLRELAGPLQKLRTTAASTFEGATTASVSQVSPAPTPARIASPPPPLQLRAAESNGDGGSVQKLVPRQQQILNALAAFEDLGVHNATREGVALFVGRSTRPARWSMDLKEMLDAELITYPAAGQLQLTPGGRAQAVKTNQAQTLAEFHQKWIGKLPPRQGNLLQALISSFPHSISREDLAELVQRSTKPARWSMDLNAMKKLSLIEYPEQGHVVASRLLFPPGLV